MKIAIPGDERDITSEVCISFGRTPYFIVFDTETKSMDVIDNSEAASSGGAGIKAAQSLVDANIDVLLTPRCGENAAEVLTAAEVNLFKTVKGSVKENIDLYMSDKLEVLNEIHVGFHGQGGK